MNKRKFTGGILAAVTALSFCTVPYASAFDAPSDLELHIGSAELGTDEANGGMIVSVPLYMENNPGFIALSFIVRLDGRLQFEDMNAASSSAEGFGDISIGTKADWGNVIEISGFAHNTFKFEGNGQIAELHIVIPEGTQAGTYPIELLARYDDSETSIITENSESAYFGPESFSVLETGNITISAPYSPPPPPPETQPQQNSNEPANEPQQNNNEPETQAQIKQTTAASTAVSTNKTTTASDTTKKVSETLTSSSSVTETAKMTVSTAEETTSSAITSTLKNDSKKEKSADKMLIPIIAATVAVIAAAVGFIVKKKGVKK